MAWNLSTGGERTSPHDGILPGVFGELPNTGLGSGHGLGTIRGPQSAIGAPTERWSTGTPRYFEAGQMEHGEKANALLTVSVSVDNTRLKLGIRDGPGQFVFERQLVRRTLPSSSRAALAGTRSQTGEVRTLSSLNAYLYSTVGRLEFPGRNAAAVLKAFQFAGTQLTSSAPVRGSRTVSPYARASCRNVWKHTGLLLRNDQSLWFVVTKRTDSEGKLGAVTKPTAAARPAHGPPSPFVPPPASRPGVAPPPAEHPRARRGDGEHKEDKESTAVDESSDEGTFPASDGLDRKHTADSKRSGGGHASGSGGVSPAAAPAGAGGARPSMLDAFIAAKTLLLEDCSVTADEHEYWVVVPVAAEPGCRPDLKLYCNTNVIGGLIHVGHYHRPDTPHTGAVRQDQERAKHAVYCTDVSETRLSALIDLPGMEVFLRVR